MAERMNEFFFFSVINADTILPGFFLPTTYVVGGKVMFSLVFVCPQGDGGGLLDGTCSVQISCPGGGYVLSGGCGGGGTSTGPVGGGGGGWPHSSPSPRQGLVQGGGGYPDQETLLLFPARSDLA